MTSASFAKVAKDGPKISERTTGKKQTIKQKGKGNRYDIANANLAKVKWTSSRNLLPPGPLDVTIFGY